MARADFVNLPMHSRCALVVDLHAVNAYISRARLRIVRMHVGQRDEAAAILRPTLENRKIAQ